MSIKRAMASKQTSQTATGLAISLMLSVQAQRTLMEMPLSGGQQKRESNAFPFYLVFGAGNESRTRDLNLGKVALYQLSYSRISGGASRSRTGLNGFAGRGITALLSRHNQQHKNFLC